MKQRLRTLFVLVSVFALAMALSIGTASADPRGPCTNDDNTALTDENPATGKNYAKHHIGPIAKSGGVGNVSHNPGMDHQGFSFCNPSGK